MNIKQKNTRYIWLIVPVVLSIVILISGFFYIAGNTILNLARERMTSNSEKYVGYVNTWAEEILGELNIYKNAMDKETAMGEHAFSVLGTSYDPKRKEYPYGIYWGDENANFYDASGWDPGPEYIPKNRGWYAEGLEHTRFAFGEPYIDVRTDRPCVSATARMDVGGVESVLAADIYFDYAEELIAKITEQDIENAFFVSGKSKMIIADSSPNNTSKILDANNNSQLYREIFDLINRGFTGMTTVNAETTYCVTINRVSDMDWYFITGVRESTMLESLDRVVIFSLIISVVCCIAVVFLSVCASSEFITADKQAKTDPLTGMLNREGFNLSMKNAVKSAPDHGAMLMFDVDNFKKVNDELGHTEGDEFLKELADMLTEYFNRGKDISARLGGDEFAVFVGRGVSLDDVSTMLTKFIDLFHNRFDKKYEGQNLSISIGASFVKDDYGDPDAVYKRADEALYKAKNSGKDKFVIAGSKEE